jgi:transcriptional regulator with XRE-family HTH domain
MIRIGQRIRELREQHGLSQRDIERQTGIRRTYISKVEQEHVIPSLETIEKLASALRVPLYELLREPTSSGQTAPAAGEGDLFWRRLRSFIRTLSPRDRELLVSVAQGLAASKTRRPNS